MRKSTLPDSRGKYPIDDYSQRSYLALLIPGSRPNARNSPDAPPYCNRLPLKISRIERNSENFLHKNFSCELFLTRKFSDLRYLPSSSYRFTTDYSVVTGDRQTPFNDRLCALCGLFPLCQFPLCQFQHCQFPFGQLPTLSISILSIPIWTTSHFVNFYFVNSDLVNVDKEGIDKVGIDKVGS